MPSVDHKSRRSFIETVVGRKGVVIRLRVEMDDTQLRSRRPAARFILTLKTETTLGSFAGLVRSDTSIMSATGGGGGGGS